MSIDLRVGGPRHGGELGKAKHNKISDEDEMKNSTYLPLLIFSAFIMPSAAKGICPQRETRPARVCGEGISAMEQQCNGMSNVANDFLRVSATVRCLPWLCRCALCIKQAGVSLEKRGEGQEPR